MTSPAFYRVSHGISQNRQRGISLLVGVTLLLVLAIMTVTVVTVSILQEKMAGNLRDQELSFQRAESALTAALAGSGAAPFSPFDETAFDAPCSAPKSGYCMGGRADTGWTSLSDSDWSSKGKSAQDGASYIIMYDRQSTLDADAAFPSTNSPKSFRIVVRAPGLSGDNYTYVDALYRIRPEL